MSTYFNGRGIGRNNGVPQIPPNAARTRLTAVGDVAALRSGGEAEDDSTFDTLTDLFLGDLLPGPSRIDGNNLPIDEESERAISAGVPVRVASKSPGIELLVLGHLPALASVWGTQHLREISRETPGPVASVRWQGGFVSIEYFGVAPASSQVVSGAGAAGVESALECVGRTAAHVVLRAEESAELRLAECAAIDTVTILTGADEAATIGAYRTIKSLAARLPEDRSRTLRVRVVVVGADTEQSREVGARLAGTAKSCLGREVEWETTPARLGAGRPSVLAFNGRSELTPESMVAMIRSAASTVQTSTPTDDDFGSVGRVSRVQAVGLVEPFRVTPEPKPAAIAQAGTAPIAAAPTPAMVSVAAPVARTDTREQITTTVRTTEGMIEPTVRLSLSGHVAGLSSVPIACPYAEGVEFALDESGRLHVLGRLDTSRADEAALRDLMVASEWVQAHAPLLKLAGPSLRRGAETGGDLDLSNGPVMHLFSSEPKKVRRLLETDVRVHLLSPVCVGGKSGWFCTPLN